ncbi:hypothetical protein N7481_008798 [Penicillium waksmanii]|uniref:uncharacterized protein n=1 Tax=Penicillium waksmanii TaxID=69791 RepID=UPI0025484C68|nr:uncharacterized protein N7481_008798 [Penicillium waksmanii]KAJ5975091.1 hypothetical protein N7481_008798 [Penicillium waksmanii]
MLIYTRSTGSIFVSFGFLATALRAPRGLQYLGISHTDDFRHHNLYSVAENNATVEEFVDVLLLHRESLEGIKVDYEDVFDQRNNDPNRPPEINVATFLPYAKRFPKLKRREGCGKGELILFMGDYSVYDESKDEAAPGEAAEREGEERIDV